MYNDDAYQADATKVTELMEKLDKSFHGYSRMVITLACSRSIAAMLGPAADAMREDYLRKFPDYIRSIWQAMDAEIPR